MAWFDMSNVAPLTSEYQVHRAIVGYLELILPRGAVLHHSPNEVDMRGPEAARMVAKARKMGTRKGWPDIEIIWNDGRAYFLEVKTSRGRVSSDQGETMDALRRAGAKVAVVRSIEDAWDALKEWGVL
jgi:hypothetical protein